MIEPGWEGKCNSVILELEVQIIFPKQIETIWEGNTIRRNRNQNRSTLLLKQRKFLLLSLQMSFLLIFLISPAKLSKYTGRRKVASSLGSKHDLLLFWTLVQFVSFLARVNSFPLVSLWLRVWMSLETEGIFLVMISDEKSCTGHVLPGQVYTVDGRPKA